MKYVYAAVGGAVHYNGGIVRLTVGQTWDASDPFVKARSDLFIDEPSMVHRTVRPVEQATAAPGERRNTRRG